MLRPRKLNARDTNRRKGLRITIELWNVSFELSLCSSKTPLNGPVTKNTFGTAAWGISLCDWKNKKATRHLSTSSS
ncbi:hypothetical protein XA68_13159 [Ophiocordyceps unilateralis]|uniref:Uncharacterized protein n=1 Tax=Ophiocordyceps unilateralis TaxID=268505 RepID=A0A2A9PCU4_OPHUN|nr:hypothetical protein XA68_13159 [Ophiocordyceps unilateralis]